MFFSALYLTAAHNGVRCEMRSLEEADLPAGALLIAVSHSSLNYKDALALTQGAPVVRQFPMIPGIDLAGTVRASSSPHFAVGDPVLVNGHGLGETRWGGYSQLQRVPADFVTRIPANLSAAEAMALGTAGYTAALCLLALERGGVSPQSGDVLVTGASGGVGSVAIALLAAAGYRVTASTGRRAEEPYLKALGAATVIDRAELATPGKPLQKERWAAAIDSVGGATLAHICASLRYRGCVAACGLAQSMDFPATVAPFILRGITLFGIDSVNAPATDREAAWQRLAASPALAKLSQIATEIPLAEVPASAVDLLGGNVRGRIVVRVS